jgi:hypothetical protein
MVYFVELCITSLDDGSDQTKVTQIRARKVLRLMIIVLCVLHILVAPLILSNLRTLAAAETAWFVTVSLVYFFLFVMVIYLAWEVTKLVTPLRLKHVLRTSFSPITHTH